MEKYDLSDMLHYELTHPLYFFFRCFVAAFLGLFGGATLDNLIKMLQNGQYDRGYAFLFFLIQSVAIVIIFFVLTRIFPQFMPIVQATTQGLIFSVFVFSVQANLLHNALVVTAF